MKRKKKRQSKKSANLPPQPPVEPISSLTPVPAVSPPTSILLPASSIFLQRYVLLCLLVILLFDILVYVWLFGSPPDYDEPLQTMAIYGMPFLMLGALFHTQLFYWRDKAARYYERAYFVLKVLFIVPGIVMSFAASYRVLGLIDGNEAATDPVTCLYFSIVTWTTLGYGDVRPSPAARILAASESVVGYAVMAVFIGLFATLFRYIFAKRLPRESGVVNQDEAD